MSQQKIGEHATIHGVKDILGAHETSTRIFWGIVLSLSLVGLGLQLNSLFSAYLNEATGSTVGVWEPTAFPTFSVCPSLWDYGIFGSDGVFDPELSTMSDEEKMEIAAYIAGYFPQGPYYRYHSVSGISGPAFFSGNRKRARNNAVRLLHDKYNGSIEQYSLLHSVDPSLFIKDVNFLPTNKKIEISRYLNWGGVCYSIDLPDKFGSLEIQYSTLVIAINSTEMPGHSQVPEFLRYFTINTGGLSEEGVFQSKVNVINYGGLSIVRLIPYGKLKYPTRRQYCITDQKFMVSDFKWCQVNFANGERCQDKCKLLIASSKNRPTKVVDPENICNLYDDASFPCAEDAMNLTMAEFETQCHPPCRHEFFLSLVESSKNNDNLTTLQIIIENPNMGAYIKEYPLFTTATFFSNIGGTSSLWFGASLLSYVQLGLCCVHRILNKCWTIGNRVWAE